MYSILVSYANKNNSPYIGINSFLEFLGNYAKGLAAENPEWRKWASDNTAKFWAEISALVEDGKCELLTDTDDGRIYVANYYPQRIQKSYQNPDEDADIPFHSEERLKITLPENQMKILNGDSDIISYMEEPQSEDIPILRINFADGFGSALVLASMIPRKVLEISMLKIRNYLRKGGNKEYLLRKLLPQLQGRESNLRDIFNKIVIRPGDCCRAIEEGGEFSGLFWGHFCVALKADIRKKKECLPEDIAAMQSTFIIDALNTHFKSLALKRREIELAFKSLENHLLKPPFLYTLDQICKFTTPKGILLLTQYTNDDLQAWLKKKTTESEDNTLPPLLIVRGDGGERYFVWKEKMPALCVRLLTLARVQVKDALTKHWRKLLLNYSSESAMEKNDDFEKTLMSLSSKYCPTLTTILDDPKLSLIYDELEKKDGGIPAAASIFAGGQLLPYSSLLLLRRKEFLADLKLMLPIWYSLPIISAIIAFFKNASRSKKAKKVSEKSEIAAENILEDKDGSGEISAAAKNLEYVLVPSGHTIETYMEDLETRWTRLIDKQARKNLIEDVRSLIRDNLRRTLRVQKRFKITREIISELARGIVINTPSIASLSGRDSLIIYTELYLIKLLGNIKQEKLIK